jgi:putative toxin-antitoxin system antitoxin component (TIGR02293 family)
VGRGVSKFFPIHVVLMSCAMTALRDILKTGLVDSVDIARLLGTTNRSVARWQHDHVDPSRREHLDRLLELKAATDLALQVMPAASAAMWLRAPIPALDYDKPLDLIRDGEFRRVIAGLAALAEGVLAPE